MDRPGLLYVIIGIVIIIVGAPVLGGTIGTVITIVGALLACYGAYQVWDSRPSS